MRHLLSLGETTGFAKAASQVWLFGGSSVFRPEGRRLLEFPWTGVTARPHRYGDASGLWDLEGGKRPLRRVGPDLATETGAWPEFAHPYHFCATPFTACWTGPGRTVFRTDGRDDRVHPDLVAVAEDLHPLEDATALIAFDMLIVYRDGRHTDVRLPATDSAHPWQILRAGPEGVWVRPQSGGAYRIRGLEVEPVGLPLVPAGDSFAVDGAERRLHEHPLASHNALRGARHLFVDGDAIWAALSEGVARVAKGRAENFAYDGPSHSEFHRVFEDAAGRLIVCGDDEELAVNREEPRGWSKVSAVQGRLSDIAFDGRELWVTTWPKAYRAAAPRYRLEEVPGITGVDRVAVVDGTVAVRSENRIHLKRPGDATWRELVLPMGWSSTGMRTVALVNGRVASLVTRMGVQELAVWEEGEWSLLKMPGRSFMYDRRIWSHEGRMLCRWSGGDVIERWTIPVEILGRSGSDDGTTEAIWWQNGAVFFRGDCVEREVRRVLESPLGTVETTMRDRERRYWISATRGVLVVSESETQVAGPMEPMEPVPAVRAGMA